MPTNWGSRNFAKASSQYCTLTGLPILTSGFSFSCRYNLNSLPGAFPNRFFLLYVGNNTLADINYTIFFDNTNGFLFQFTTAASTYVTTTAANTFDTGVWHALAFTTNFSSTAQFYLDGVAITTTVGTGAPEPTTSTQTLGAAGNITEFTDGQLADMAIWASQLSALEVAALAKGMRPGQVHRPSSGGLAGWWPLDGLQSPEPDLSGRLETATLVNGPTAAFGPPIAPFTRRWPMGAILPTSAPTFNPAWARGKNVVIEGVAT
jgi:hypothetical protein